MTSDGEWQEGSTWEALIFATHRKLDNLTILVDHNGLQGFGTTEAVASMSPLNERLSGFNLDTRICNGHDLNEMRSALAGANRGPALVILNTIKGRGLPRMSPAGWKASLSTDLGRAARPGDGGPWGHAVRAELCQHLLTRAGNRAHWRFLDGRPWLGGGGGGGGGAAGRHG